MNSPEQTLLPPGPETKLLEPPHPHHISPWKVILILSVLAAIVAVVAIAGFVPRRHREEAAAAAANQERTTLPKVTSAPVRRAAADTEVALPGTLSALTETSIY